MLEEAGKCILEYDKDGNIEITEEIKDDEVVSSGDENFDTKLIQNKLNSIEMYPFCTKRVICFYGERGTGKTNLCVQMGLNNILSYDED